MKLFYLNFGTELNYSAYYFIQDVTTYFN